MRISLKRSWKESHGAEGKKKKMPSKIRHVSPSSVSVWRANRRHVFDLGTNTDAQASIGLTRVVDDVEALSSCSWCWLCPGMDWNWRRFWKARNGSFRRCPRFLWKLRNCYKNWCSLLQSILFIVLLLWNMGIFYIYLFIYFYFLLLVTIIIHGILRPFIQATFGWKRIHHPNWSREKNKNLFIYLFFFSRVTIENKERKWANISLWKGQR